MTDLEIFKKWRKETLAYPGELMEEINFSLETEYKDESEVTDDDWHRLMKLSIADNLYDVIEDIQEMEWQKAQPHNGHLVYELPDNFCEFVYKEAIFGEDLDLSSVLKNIFSDNCVLNITEDEVVGYIEGVRVRTYLSCYRSNLINVYSSNTWSMGWPDTVIRNLLGIERNGRNIMNVIDEDDNIIVNVYVSNCGLIHFSFYTTQKRY